MKLRKIVVLLMTVILMLCNIQTAYADIPYRSYTYSYWGEAKDAPQAYIMSKQITGEGLECGSFKEPQGIFVKDNKIYIVDTGNNRIIITDKQWGNVKIINHVLIDGNKSFLNQPLDVFINDAYEMYIADTGNERILHIDEDGELIVEIKKPVSDLIPVNAKFEPLKLVSDRAGRIYVVARNINQGLMELDKTGEFNGFVGANKVSPNLIDYFWKSIATKEQRAQMELFVPVEFNNIYLDKEGFLYTTTNAIDQYKLLQVVTSKNKDDQLTPVKKLNSMGMDILRRNGYFSPIGEIEFSPGGAGNTNGPSEIIDVVVDENNIYSLLDRKRGRIFTYDFEGNLLYVFGGVGNQEGTFKTPICMEKLDTSLIVVDRGTNIITEFKPTEYGMLINEALRAYKIGEYEKSAVYWQQVLKMNANYDAAYVGIGRSLYREGEFEEALRYFRLGNNKENYSNTYKLYRKEFIEENFNLISGSILLLAILYYAYYRLVGKKKNRDTRKYGPLRYALYVIFRPIDGFWDLKYEKRGNLKAAIIIIAATVITYIFTKQRIGFLFNNANPREFNILIEIASIIIPFVLWCVANWCLTTLMDGKGNFRDIVIATAYALVPIILINLPMTVVSNVITIEEGVFYYFLLAVANIWTITLLLVGSMCIHDYSISKTIGVGILTLVGMGIMIFIAVLFFNLIEEMVVFITTLYNEIVFRL